MYKGPLLEIPYGTRDFLPKDAKKKREIEFKLIKNFNLWGFDEIVTPTIEYVDTLTLNNRNGIENYLFKFFDRNNKTVALRHEMTTPIARVAASRMSEDILPYKLSYISNVYRYEQTQEGRQCEFYQAGVELMGASKALADAEIIALAIDSLQKIGLKDFKVCIGQVDFINGIIQQMGLSKEKQLQVRYALEKCNLVDLNRIIENTNLSKHVKEALKSIPMLQGKEEILEVASNLVLNEQSKNALDNLHNIYNLLKVYNLTDCVYFDLGVIRDFDYYTGMIFEIYTPMIGYPICGGGRYDKMLADFGTDCPATGFAMGIERLMLVLDKQNKFDENKENKKDIYIAYTNDKLNEAIILANKLRNQGMIVELALKNQTKQEAQLYIKNKLFKELVYLE